MNDLESSRQWICEIGRRAWQKQFVSANEGNLSVRMDDGRIVCTPTLISKGHMRPEDLCLCDLDGNQLGGERRLTSEIRLHLTIYRHRPDIRAVVHTHPPHATAFAIAREAIPNCILPEPDVLLGEVPIAPYKTPGTQEFADTIVPFVDKTGTIILANHGVVSYSDDLERAFWMTEVLDSYCRTLILAKQLGRVNFLSVEEGQDLLKMRCDWGFADPRSGPEYAERQSEIRDHMMFRDTFEQAGVKQSIFQPPPTI